MVETLIGSGVTLLLGGAVIFLGHRLISRYTSGQLAIKQQEMTLKEERQRVELLERKTKAEVDSRSVDALADLRQAELMRETAAAQRSAELASDPDVAAARKQAEIDVIAAQRDARITAAPQSVAEPGETEALIKGYKAYLDTLDGGEPILSFGEWRG